jgi:hypothetical protein
MKIRWFGQAAFRVECADGTTIVTDPYGDIGYPPLHVTADYVTKSHSHGDHANVDAVSGAKRVFDQAGEYRAGGVAVKAAAIAAGLVSPSHRRHTRAAVGLRACTCARAQSYTDASSPRCSV